MFSESNFDFVEFFKWFESIIDYILKLFEKIKASTTTTTTIISEEEVV